MNPIEKAVAKADQIIAFNRELERISALSAHGVKIVDTIDACYCDVSLSGVKPHDHRAQVCTSIICSNLASVFGTWHTPWDSATDGKTFGFCADCVPLLPTGCFTPDEV